MFERRAQIDQFLARALAGPRAPWPEFFKSSEDRAAIIERAIYHGIAGLLIERKNGLIGWPADVLASLSGQAVAQAMWEMRHKIVLTDLLNALADIGTRAIILKGTALAYYLYENPATRARGDTDILVARSDLKRTRPLLQAMGFQLDSNCEGRSDELSLQEVWDIKLSDGTSHTVDLHWQAMNSLALEDSLTFDDCSANPLKLPRLCDTAFAMDRKTALIFACVHRAAHITSPYIVDGVIYYGGDRLIWAYDIHLLAGAHSAGEWDELCTDALDKGLGAVCLNGLTFAQKRLGTRIPSHVIERLSAAPRDTKASAYLLESGQAARALHDLRAVPGLAGKLKFLYRRVLPPATFMRAKYPLMHDRAIALLYLRRIVELLRKRPDRSER